jgi:hypothetical protein
MTNELSLKALIKKIYTRRKQSVWTVTEGKKQSGKTNFVLRQMELLHELGLADGFGSNMRSLKAPFEVDFIEDFQTLKKRCQMLNPDPEKHGIKRYFFFGSEMGKWLPRDQPWRNTKFIEELQLVRKVGLNWLGDGINRIDERVVNETHFDGKFRKVSIMRPDMATYLNYSTNRTETIHGIKPTTLKYNTWESCNFYMEPQTEETDIPLNADHLIVKQYLEAGCSIAKTGLHANEVKRARDRVLQYYWKHHLAPSIDIDKEIVEGSSID